MYRTIAASFWTDPKVKELAPDGKLLLLYLITNPHTHVSGIYILNLKHAAASIGYSANTLSRNLDTLSRLGFCVFDKALDVIWVRKMMSYQGKGEKNLRSAAAHVAEDLHNSFLCKEFLNAYPDVKQYVKKAFLDTLSEKPDRVSEFGTPDPDFRFQISDPDTRERSEPPSAAPKIAHGEFKQVLLTEEELGKLRVKLNSHLSGYIDRLDRYSQNKPKEFAKYSSHYATILTWFDRDVKEGRVGAHQQDSSGGSPASGSGARVQPKPYTPKQR